MLAERALDFLRVDLLTAIQTAEETVDNLFRFVLAEVADEAVVEVLAGHRVINLGLFIVVLQLGEVDYAILAGILRFSINFEHHLVGLEQHEFEINTGQVDVWMLEVRTVDESLLTGLLSADELAKGRRFRFQKDRDLSWNARAALRVLLGRYLGLAPAAVQFVYEPAGRPMLAAHDLRFNVSHSGPRVAIAVARADVGVDIELRRPAESLREWTRHEAYVKALGMGIAGTPPPPDENWTFFDLSDEEYEGALAVRACRPSLRRMQLTVSA